MRRAAATHAADSRPTTDPGRSAETRPAAATAHAHSAAADVSAASDGMRNSAASAATSTSTSASAASSGPRIGSARESGDHGGNGENLDV